ncbi:MAG: hypothetical protein ACXADC_04825 [Candidatus Thorarchaeota archaeon]|jgi:hypothetical protein
MSLDEFFSEDVLEWLLEEENPSVRYWALQQLQDKSRSDADVIEAQKRVMQSECVKTIMTALTKDGFWGKTDNMYEPKYRAATHTLLLLAELGAERIPEIERAIEHLFLFQRDSGHFLMNIPKTTKGRASIVKDACCLDGNILYYLLHFGYFEDERVQRLIDFQVDYYDRKNGGWKCRAFPIDSSKVVPTNCFMGRVKMLRGLSSIPDNSRTKEIRTIIDEEVEVVLENRIYKYLKNSDGTRKEKAGWKRFGFPLFYQSDILEVLDVLTLLGVRDDKMLETIDYVIENKGKDGKWLLKNSYNGKMLCDIDIKGQPSKWVTLRALRVLRRFLRA